MKHQADCKTIVDPECGPCTCPTPSALTREQVEMQVMLCQGPHSTQMRDGAAAIILTHDAAQRATIEQQAQEIERLTVELLAARSACDAWGNQVAKERKQLADMTKEKDESVGENTSLRASCHAFDLQVQELQARVQELEGTIAVISNAVPGEERINAIANAILENTADRQRIAQLQATLAEREARIAELEAERIQREGKA